MRRNMKKLLIKYIQKKMAPYLDGVTIEQQIDKVEEEKIELGQSLGSGQFCFYSIRALLFIMFNKHFVELYELYIKNKYESERADLLIASCSLNYLCNGSGVCNNYELEDLFDLFVTDTTDFLHLIMKLRYNMKRKDWKLNNKQ